MIQQNSIFDHLIVQFFSNNFISKFTTEKKFLYFGVKKSQNIFECASLKHFFLFFFDVNEKEEQKKNLKIVTKGLWEKSDLKIRRNEKPLISRTT